MIRSAILAALTVLILIAGALGHESRPLNILLTETAPGTLTIRWQVPPSVGAANRPDVTVTGSCRAENDGHVTGLNGARLYRCPSGPAGASVQIRFPRYNPSVSTLLRLTLLSGEKHTALLGPDRTSWPIPDQESTTTVAWQYLTLGVRHILQGADHLLFLACLLFIARTWRRILITVTGFTIAHSITLALAALGVVKVPVPPVEAAIALSIVFLAVEIVRNRADTLTMRYPITVSSSFGLLHGFGFAAVLAEIGLPQVEVPAALLFFNLGVEIGQLIFVCAAIMLWLAFARLTEGLGARSTAYGWATRAAVYCVGAAASFWTVDRISGFWA